jgi:hypothetical protein
MLREFSDLEFQMSVLFAKISHSFCESEDSFLLFGHLLGLVSFY